LNRWSAPMFCSRVIQLSSPAWSQIWSVKSSQSN